MRVLVRSVLLLASVALASRSYALDPSRTLSQYVHRIWQVQQGLPQASIYSIVETRDGYLWLGTQTGLVKFDGVRFTTIDDMDGVSSADIWVTHLLEDREHALWIGTNHFPKPGDIVTLYYPPDPSRVFVKRVIAQEGQAVLIVDGRVFVDGKRLDDAYVPPQFRSDDDWGPQRVPLGYYFVMGDHRNDSSDSRDWGMVPWRYIVGKVKARLWPLQELRLF